MKRLISFLATIACTLALNTTLFAQETIGTSSEDSNPFLYHEDMETHLTMQDANHDYAEGNYKKAIARVDALLEKDPSIIPALVLRARARATVSDTAGAFHDLRQIIQYNPDSPDGYLYLSKGYVQVKSYREALKWANQGLEKDPQNPEAYIQRGEVKFLLGDKKGACLDWSKAGSLGDLEAYDIIFEKCTNVSMVR